MPQAVPRPATPPTRLGRPPIQPGCRPLPQVVRRVVQVQGSCALSVMHRLLLLSTDGFASRHRHRHAGKPEMLTQGRSLVCAPEQPAALQCRDYEIDEIGEGAGEIGGSVANLHLRPFAV